ncbi:MAG: hypothetical protein IT203_01955, partial [Fimbriimonadaceae bacterium]|nr:hypothetical protein [Fimbriimonadaceae bacterium]
TSTMRTVIYLTVPVTVLMFVMAPQIVGAMYEHGKFTAADSAATANCLRFFSIGITAWCLHPVLMRGFFAMQNTITPIVLGTLTTILFVVLIFFFRGMGMEYQALPLAGSLSAFALVVVLAIAVAPKIGGLDLKGLSVTILKSLIGCAGLAAIGAGVAYTPFGRHIAGHKFQTLAVVGVVFLVGAWLYYFITKALGMPETGYVSRAMARIQRRREPVTDIEAGND